MNRSSVLKCTFQLVLLINLAACQKVAFSQRQDGSSSKLDGETLTTPHSDTYDQTPTQSQFVCYGGQMSNSEMSHLLATPAIIYNVSNSNITFTGGRTHYIVNGSGNTISTGNGSSLVEINGDSNTVRLGGGSNVYNFNGSNNFYDGQGGGSNILNFAGATNSLSFGGGGCQSAYFAHGTLDVVVPTVNGGGGSSVNDVAAITARYTLE